MDEGAMVGSDMAVMCEGPCKCLECRSLSLCIQLSRDDDALDLGRAFVNLRHLRIPEQSLDGEILDVAVPAEDLDGLCGDPHGGLTRDELAHRAELRDRLAAVLGRGR